MPYMQMDLTGEWMFKEFPREARRMRDLEGDDWLPTPAPHSIYGSLIHAGRVDADDLDANPERYEWVSERPWVYRRHFEATTDLLACERLDLVFDGLDTAAQIWLNDKLIGKTDNMFIAHRFDVKQWLREGDNCLQVKFTPAREHAERLMHRYGRLIEDPLDTPWRSYIRKARYQMGSDQSPYLPGCGIIRDVRIEGFAAARLADVHVRTVACSEQEADVRVSLEVETVRECPLTCEIRLHGGGLDLRRQVALQPHDRRIAAVLHVDRPFLWWPRGYGVPHLYTLDVSLREDQYTVDRRNMKVGIRTVRIQRQDVGGAPDFQWVVNDRPVYARGMTVLPPTLLAGCERPEDYERLVQTAAEMNCNLLRVHAAGYPPDGRFYEACDRHGQLVWQDFFFDRAYYPDRQWFTEAVRTETERLVQRLRSHACLALWCGNHRIDSLHRAGRLGKSRKFYGAGIYHTLLPSLLADLDADRDYVPTSDNASRETSASGLPEDMQRLWEDYAPPRDVALPREALPHMASGFGIVSAPVPMLRRPTDAEPARPEDYRVEKHNYTPDGAARLARYVSEWFAAPSDLNDWACKSQLAQARLSKLFVEHLRAHGDRSRGVILHSLNESNRAIGFGSIDVCGRPKAMYYYARRFFAPVLVTLNRRFGGRRPDLRPEWIEAAVVVVNDTAAPLTGRIEARQFRLNGELLDRWELPVSLLPFTRSTPSPLPRTMARPEEPEQCFLHLQVTDSRETTVSENLFLYVPDKHLPHQAGSVQIQMEPDEHGGTMLWLSSDCLVKDCRVHNANQALWADDQFFDLLPAIKRGIRVEGIPEATDPSGGLTLRSTSCETRCIKLIS